MITLSSYRNYLISLKDMIFKVLPLYEEKSETFDEYLDSLYFELCGLAYVIEDLPHEVWYVKTIANLEAISYELSRFDDVRRVKKEVFNILKLIDKQIDQLKGE